MTACADLINVALGKGGRAALPCGSSCSGRESQLWPVTVHLERTQLTQCWRTGFCFVLFSCLHVIMSSLVVIFFSWSPGEEKRPKSPISMLGLFGVLPFNLTRDCFTAHRTWPPFAFLARAMKGRLSPAENWAQLNWSSQCCAPWWGVLSRWGSPYTSIFFPGSFLCPSLLFPW